MILTWHWLRSWTPWSHSPSQRLWAAPWCWTPGQPLGPPAPQSPPCPQSWSRTWGQTSLSMLGLSERRLYNFRLEPLSFINMFVISSQVCWKGQLYSSYYKCTPYYLIFVIIWSLMFTCQDGPHLVTGSSHLRSRVTSEGSGSQRWAGVRPRPSPCLCTQYTLVTRPGPSPLQVWCLITSCDGQFCKLSPVFSPRVTPGLK